jgi:hypothetical protein
MRRTLSLVTVLSVLPACHHAGHHAPETPLTEVAIAVPLAPGKTEAWRSSIQELTGPRYAEYEASRKRFGLTAQMTFLQQTPMGDFAVIHMTGPDVHASFHAMASSKDAWDVKWRELTLDLHGVDFGKGERVMPKVTPLFSTGDVAPAGAKPFMFLAPLGAGGAARLQAVATELMGPKHADYVQARARLGVRREAVFLESTAMGDAAVFYWLADDPVASLSAMTSSQDPFDVWLRGEAGSAHPLPLDAIVAIASKNALIGEYPHPR